MEEFSADYETLTRCYAAIKAIVYSSGSERDELVDKHAAEVR